MSAILKRIRRRSQGLKSELYDGHGSSSSSLEAVETNDEDKTDVVVKNDDEKKTLVELEVHLRHKQEKERHYRTRLSGIQTEILLMERELEATMRDIKLIKEQGAAMKKLKSVKLHQLNALYDNEVKEYTQNVKEKLPQLYTKFAAIKTEKDLKETTALMNREMAAYHQLQLLLNKKSLDMKAMKSKKRNTKEKNSWKFDKKHFTDDTEDSEATANLFVTNKDVIHAPILKRKVYKRQKQEPNDGSSSADTEMSQDELAFLQICNDSGV